MGNIFGAKQSRKKIASLLFLGTNILSLPCFASQRREGQLSYNLEYGTVSISGISKNAMEKKLPGLSAEIAARQNGVDLMEEKISAECNSKKSDRKIKSDWKQRISSKGSEIFADGSLLIYLSIPIKDIIKFEAKFDQSDYITEDEQEVVFTLPQLPAGTTQCGSVAFELNDKKYEVFPMRVRTGKAKSNSLVIPLVLGEGKILRVASPEDKTKLKNMEFLSSNPHNSFFLPIAGG